VHVGAACVTVNACPAMVSVPVRCVELPLTAAANATVPLPLPLAPLVTVNQEVSLLTAVHAHPDAAITLAEPVPPSARTDWLNGETEYVHDAPACVTLNVCPPIVIVPVRCVVLALTAALKATVPFPLPLAPLVTVNQEVSLLTPVHAHPVGAVTAVDPVPPPATTD
jgi:hypothetical protein